MKTELVTMNPPEILALIQGYVSDCSVTVQNGKKYEINYSELKEALLNVGMDPSMNISTLTCRRPFILDSSYKTHFKTLEKIIGDVKCVGNMKSMFEGSILLESCSGNWDTSRVTDMSFMFHKAKRFKQTLHWNTSNVTDNSHMFT